MRFYAINKVNKYSSVQEKNKKYWQKFVFDFQKFRGRFLLT